MFINFDYSLTTTGHHTMFLLNTVLLIGLLVLYELLVVEENKLQKPAVKVLLPIFLVLVVCVGYAAYVQFAK